MIRHLLKLVWNRKRGNALLIAEIFFSFIVLFTVITLAVSLFTRYRKPLGFEYQNVWMVGMSFPSPASITDAQTAALRPVVERILLEIHSFPQVEGVTLSMTPPFSQGTWVSGFEFNGHKMDVTRDTVGDDFARVMHTPLRAGRWFSAGDEVAKVPVSVIDSDVATKLFGDRNPIGLTVRSGDDHVRIIGVIAPFRKDGEFSAEHVNMVFNRFAVRAKKGEVPRNLLIRVRPGTPAGFEETLIKRLHAVAPDYPARITHLEQARHLTNNIMLTPAIAGGIVAAFLIIMVALGLSGVLWQSVTRRTRELGLRRALGATSGSVLRQVLAEVALLSSIAVVAGALVIAQLPLLGAFRIVSPPAYSAGLLIALATIYAITLMCGLYPSWLAGKIQPAQALHYE